MGDLVRASGLINIPELIERHGGDARALMAWAGIDPLVVGDYNRFITYTSLTALVGRASEVLDLPDFGLRVSRVQSLEMLGPIAVLARNAETVESALLGVIKYLHTYSPAIKADLLPRGKIARFTFTITVARLPYRAHLVELALGVILGMFELLAGAQFRPQRVTFQHSRMSDVDVYTDYFGAPVAFNDEVNSIVFPTSLLTRRIEGGDDQAHALAREFLGSQHRHLDVDEHVHEMLRKLVPLNEGRLDTVAEALRMHPRALQRQLRELDTSFEELLDGWRRDTAEELLGRPEISMAEIAQQLGYSEQSAFTRSCKRWFGEPPLARRRRLHRGVRRPRPL
ncbi:AraC family transcriptional regulator [Kribbia dieselivorans]|uniref:AraC family transcriptional regulator n=1 Tax=Kribbia dieselivorans TaxID=331526 RepID=UPI0009FA02F4|nr:AraC family transcriptional regulator [Kribbia dieselivorans]